MGDSAHGACWYFTDRSGWQIFLRGVPSSARAPISRDILHALLTEAGFAECVWLDDAMDQAVQDCNAKTTPFALQIAQRSDAQIAVVLSTDKMEAQISVVPPRGAAGADR